MCEECPQVIWPEASLTSLTPPASNGAGFPGQDDTEELLRRYFSLSLDLGAANPGLFFTCANLATIALRVLGMRRLDGLNPGRAAGLALLFLGLLVPCFGLAPRFGDAGETALLAMAVLYGLALGLCMPLFNAAMYRVSLPKLRGTNTNLLLVALDAGFILGPVIGGWMLAADMSLQSLFAMSGAALLAAGLLVLPVGRLTPGRMKKA